MIKVHKSVFGTLSLSKKWVNAICMHLSLEGNTKMSMCVWKADKLSCKAVRLPLWEVEVRWETGDRERGHGGEG